jgi:hypothetical protein
VGTGPLACCRTHQKVAVTRRRVGHPSINHQNAGVTDREGDGGGPVQPVDSPNSARGPATPTNVSSAKVGSVAGLRHRLCDCEPAHPERHRGATSTESRAHPRAWRRCSRPALPSIVRVHPGKWHKVTFATRTPVDRSQDPSANDGAGAMRRETLWLGGKLRLVAQTHARTAGAHTRTREKSDE